MTSARDLLSSARVRAVNKHPYFSSIVFNMRPVETPGLGTMAVDRGLRLFYDPATVESWGSEGTAAVVVHEAGHILRKHDERRGDRDPELWNWAGDLEWNDDVVKAGWKLPGDCLMPAKFGLKDGGTAEQYYADIESKVKKVKIKVGSTAGTGGKCGGCAGNPGPEGDSKEGEPKGNGKGNVPPPLSQGEVAVVRNQTAQAIQDYEKAHGRGSVPASWAAWANQELLPPKVPWQRVLGKYVREALTFKAGQLDYTYSRLSRAWLAQRVAVPNTPVRPGMHAPVPKLALVVDSSGSMSGGRYRRALSEAVGVVKATGADIKAYATDAAVNAVVKLVSERDIQKLGFSGGGTDMPVGIEAADKDNPDVILCLTDGDTGWPSPKHMPKAKLIVCIVSDDAEKVHVPDHIKLVVRTEL